MDKILTWDEMKSIFPDEWLLITDFELDQSGHLISGIVARHSVDKDDVYRLPALEKPSAFKYTGESTFREAGELRPNIATFNTSSPNINLSIFFPRTTDNYLQIDKF